MTLFPISEKEQMKHIILTAIGCGAFWGLVALIEKIKRGGAR